MFEFDNIYARSGNKNDITFKVAPGRLIMNGYIRNQLTDAFALNMMPYLVYYNLLMPEQLVFACVVRHAIGSVQLHSFVYRFIHTPHLILGYS